MATQCDVGKIACDRYESGTEGSVGRGRGSWAGARAAVPRATVPGAGRQRGPNSRAGAGISRLAAARPGLRRLADVADVADLADAAHLADLADVAHLAHLPDLAELADVAHLAGRGSRPPGPWACLTAVAGQGSSGAWAGWGPAGCGLRARESAGSAALQGSAGLCWAP
ncbi:hypothetical protein GCM10010451_56130 [Streptomyces virens]|uniref:Uncharacterized protein n=1 Tax=Streptomyces virens TaxID=285572 RepID=A0ABP6Q148_9ACTN